MGSAGFSGESVAPSFHFVVDAFKGVGGRSLDLVLNKEKAQGMLRGPLGNPINASSWPVDSVGLLSEVVTGVIQPELVQKQMLYHGFICRNYNDDFFQHSTTAANVGESMLDFVVKLNELSKMPAMRDVDWTVFGAQAHIPLRDLLTLYNRGNIDDKTAGYHLLKEGVRDQGTADALMSLRHEIPPVADLIRFAVRDVFFPDIVKDYGEANEYPKVIDKFIKWQGLGWDTGYLLPESTDVDGNIVPAHNANWGELAWVAHWEFPSVTAGYDMLHMLYTESRYGPSPYTLDAQGQVDKTKTFDKKDHDRLLRAAGYSTYWRNKMEAISYPPLTRVDTQRMFHLGIIDLKEMYHNYRLQGYDDINAVRLSKFTQIEQRPDIIKDVEKLFELGTLDEDQYRVTLKQALYSPVEIESSLARAKLSVLIKETEAMIGHIHGSVSEGIIDLDQTRVVLSQLGIVPQRIDRYIGLWRGEIDFGQRSMTLRKLVDWYQTGVINRDDMIGRLQRLRYQDKDINAILKSVELKKVQAKQKEEDKQLKQREADAKKQQQQADKQRKAMENAIKKGNELLAKRASQHQKELSAEEKVLQQQLKAEHTALMDATKALKASSTDVELVKYWKAGVITLPEVRVRLSARDFLPADIERWIQAYLSPVTPA